MTRDQSFVIRIDHAPAGEAPLWVREAWIGLKLPVYGLPVDRSVPSVGVLTGPKTLIGTILAPFTGRVGRTHGYSVRARDAVELLDETRPDAALWWRQNAPRLTTGSGSLFMFDSLCCTLLRRVDDPA